MQPDTSLLAEQIKSCLQETEEVPLDITSLFDNSLFKLDTSVVTKAIKYVRPSLSAVISTDTVFTQLSVFTCRKRLGCIMHQSNMSRYVGSGGICFKSSGTFNCWVTTGELLPNVNTGVNIHCDTEYEYVYYNCCTKYDNVSFATIPSMTIYLY